MTRRPRFARGLHLTAAGSLVAWPLLLSGCVQEGDTPAIVGEPCITADEADAQFSGFTLGEVNIEARGSCGTEAVCLVDRFQGRVSCPEGQGPGDGSCVTPDGGAVVVPVEPQLDSRPPERAVICSCRCDGPDPNADYCDCPSGMRCEPLIASSATTRSRESDEFSGSYCVYPN